MESIPEEILEKMILPFFTFSLEDYCNYYEKCFNTCTKWRKIIVKMIGNPLVLKKIRKTSYSETAKFKENFEVYIQALISQCLDTNFFEEVYNDQGKK